MSLFIFPTLNTFLFIFVFSNFRQANADSWKHSSHLGKFGKIVYIRIYLMPFVDLTYILTFQHIDSCLVSLIAALG